MLHHRPHQGLPGVTRPFLFLRHGQSTGNRDRIVCGSLDAPLTPQGEAQARAAAPHIAAFAPDLAITTPLERAYRTAELALAGTSLVAAREPGLQERRWGVFEGGPIAAMPGEDAAPEGGETWEAFAMRVQSSLTRWLPRAERPVVIAHSGVYRVLRWLATGAPGGPRVENGAPVRVTPPAREGDDWAFEPF